MVKGVGPSNARIAIVGEAPGDAEMRLGQPFCGTAGKLLDGMLEEAGIRRESCYITNILTEQPAVSAANSTMRNNFGVLYHDKSRRQPSERLLNEVQRLSKELSDIRPNVVLALGNEPLKWLTSKNGISDWRGSVLPGPGGLKVLPTYHPAAVLRQWSWRPISVFDYKKALTEAEFPEIRQRERHVFIPHTLDEATAYLDGLRVSPEPVAFDIEVETQQIQSIAFSNDPEHAIVIPFWWGPKQSKWEAEDELNLWVSIQELFKEAKTIGQNVHYDLTFLKMMDVEAENLYMDTMVAFHVLYPELPKGLEFMTSLYTSQPYYKFMRTTSSEEEFWRYNALDAMVTKECAIEIERELRETTTSEPEEDDEGQYGHDRDY